MSAVKMVSSHGVQSFRRHGEDTSVVLSLGTHSAAASCFCFYQGSRSGRPIARESKGNGDVSDPSRLVAVTSIGSNLAAVESDAM